MNDNPPQQNVTMSERDGIAVVVIDDGKANALSHLVLDQLDECLDRAVEYPALVIAGRPGRFSAGFDLSVMKQDGRCLGADGEGAELALRLHEWPKPRCSRTGHALAMGAVLLGCADLRIGAMGEFKIGFNEVSIGLPMPEFASELHRGRLSPRHFHQAVALARIYGPEDAVEAGFLDRMTEAEVVVDEAVATAAELASRLSPPAFAITRATLDRDLTVRLRDLTSGWADQA
ncbi:MAG: crotonase/enoyl-CoA hydratase family protein [Microthrixaceae bacterium]|nr:crotonase/enoyl-CoA hydratase family protein [Microthrixaceae bacterium]